MFPELSRTARHTALLIALLSAVSLCAQFWHLMQEMGQGPLATLA